MEIETIKKLCSPFDKAYLELTLVTKDTKEILWKGCCSVKIVEEYIPLYPAFQS